MTKFSVLAFSMILALCASLAVAQSSDEAEIRQLIERRFELLNKAKSTASISELVSLHAKDFRSITATYNPDGSFTRNDRDLAGMKELLTHYSDAGDIHYVTKLENIAFTNVYPSTAVVIYRGSYELRDANTEEKLFGGDQIVTSNLKKTPDGWKIYDIYTTELRNEVNKYPCAYELYQKNSNELLVSVKVPAGAAFRNEFIDIRFKEAKPGLFIVHTDNGDEFSWENNVLRATYTNESGEIAGRPNNKTAVCEDIIMYYHGDACSDTRLHR